MKPQIRIINADITTLSVEAIVNAANPTLYGGGGVDGAIHDAAGPNLLHACKNIRKSQYPQGLPTGQAVITPGFNLSAKHIIHTVGPVYHKDDLALLADCYRNSLKLAEDHNCKSIAFPSISTGAYGVPITQAVKIVKKVIDSFESQHIKEIILVLHTVNDLEIYLQTFKDG